MPLNPQILSLALSLRQQREQAALRAQERDEKRKDQLFDQILELRKQGVPLKNLEPFAVSQGIGSDRLELFRGLDKTLRQTEKSQQAETQATGLAGQAGTLAAGTANVAGKQRPTPQAEQLAGLLFQQAQLANARSATPLENLPKIESEFLSSKATRTKEQQDKAAEQRRTLEADSTKRARELAQGEPPLSRDKVFTLRKEHRTESKPFTEIQTTFRSATRLADRARRGDPTAQQRLTVMIEKLTDPESVVRASEAERTLATLAALDRLALEARGLLNSRQTLTPELVDNVMANMGIMYQSEAETQRSRRRDLEDTLAALEVDDRKRRAILGQSQLEADLMEEAERLERLPVSSGSRTDAPAPRDPQDDKLKAPAASYLKSLGLGVP